VSGLHADALATLRSWRSGDPGQERLRQEYVDHLTAHADGLTRASHPDHVTAGALVLSADRTEVLLTLHAKAHRWFHLGGHCEPADTTLAGAALREATEESIDVRWWPVDDLPTEDEDMRVLVDLAVHRARRDPQASPAAS
jgi:8-oxo-dGTP pyrophosphatase MutT (NUDIX family)